MTYLIEAVEVEGEKPKSNIYPFANQALSFWETRTSQRGYHNKICRENVLNSQNLAQ